MNKNSGTSKDATYKLVRDIKHKVRKFSSAQEKIRVVLAEVCKLWVIVLTQTEALRRPILEPISILLDQLRDIARGTIEFLPQLAVAILVLACTIGLNKFVGYLSQRLLAKTNLRPSLKELFALLSSIVVWILGLMIAAVIVFPGLTPSSILAGLGIGSVAIGFAFKDIFENFLAGIIILFRREMRIGDYIECVEI